MPIVSSGTLALLGAQDRSRADARDGADRTLSPQTDPERYTEGLGLLVVRAPNPSNVGAYNALNKAEAVIGRVGGTADVCVSDPGVSRCHAKIIRGAGDELRVEDLG